MRKTVLINGVDYRAYDDGETHINIYSKGRSDLGRFLSNFTRSDTVTDHGKFRSLEGYYHFLRGLAALRNCKRDVRGYEQRLEDLRYVDGGFAQSLGRWIRSDFIKDAIHFVDLDDEFFAHFKSALTAKVEHPEYKEKFYSSRLPFTHYYIVGNGGIYHHPRFDWLSNMLEDIRDDAESV